MSEIAALYVMKDGPYFNVPGINPWDEERDARKFKGPCPVIAHPPCERWGRYWGGGPMLHGTKLQKILGDDNQCFSHALWAVRSFGGVLEHPEASHAFRFYGLSTPKQKGGWTEPDIYGGRSYCVAQGRYGHRAQKLTWLYAVGIDFEDLKWGLTPGLMKLEDGFHSKEHRASSTKNDRVKRITSSERLATPEEFKKLLIKLAMTAMDAEERG